MSVATGEGDIEYERSNLSRHHTDPNQCELLLIPRSSEYNSSEVQSCRRSREACARFRNSECTLKLAAEVPLPPKTKPNQTKHLIKKKTGVSSNGGVLASATLRSILPFNTGLKDQWALNPYAGSSTEMRAHAASHQLRACHETKPPTLRAFQVS